MQLTATSPLEKLKEALKLVSARMNDTSTIRKQMSNLNNTAERLRLNLLKLEYAGRDKNAAEIRKLTETREKTLAEFSLLNDQASATRADIARYIAQVRDVDGGSNVILCQVRCLS